MNLSSTLPSGDNAGEGARKNEASAPEEIDWSRRVPIRHEVDVVVVGGGLGGVCAAAAAARSGAHVVLVERFAVLGGLLTSGGVAYLEDAKVFRSSLGEVFTEILKELDAWQAIGDGLPAAFHRETLAIILQELLLRRGVKLLLNTRMVDACVRDDGRISEIIVCGSSGPEALRARQFIDSSGDSALARAAGFTLLGDWDNDERRIATSIMYFVRETAAHPLQPSMPQGWSRDLTEVKLSQRAADLETWPPKLPKDWSTAEAPVCSKIGLRKLSIWPDGPGSKAVKLWFPAVDATRTDELTAAEILARRCMMETMDFHQRVEKRPWILDHSAPMLGIRDGACIAGDYILTEADLRAGRAFADGVARGTYQLHLGPYPEALSKDVPPHHIPLRSLIARDGRNLMMAGRNLSADRHAQSSVRVSTSVAMMGQAVGIAAALAAQRDTDVRSLNPDDIRRIILERGAVLEV